MNGDRGGYRYRCVHCQRRVQTRVPYEGRCPECGSTLVQLELPRFSQRWCVCGVILASDNPSPNCSLCQHDRDTANYARLRERLEKRLVRVSCSPRAYVHPKDYAADIWDAISALAELRGLTPPDLSDRSLFPAWRSGGAVLQGDAASSVLSGVGA